MCVCGWVVDIPTVDLPCACTPVVGLGRQVGSLGSVLARCQQMSTGRVLNQRMKGRLNVKTASPGGNLPFFNPIGVYIYQYIYMCS